MKPSKILVVYYSRTATTRVVAQTLADTLRCEIEEIVDRRQRRGLPGYLRSLLEAARRRPAKIAPPARSPEAYDLVVIGTPVWMMSVSSPVRAYLERMRSRLPAVAFFCTMGGSGSDRAFAQMEALCGKAPLGARAFLQREVAAEQHRARAAAFIKELRDRLRPGEAPADAVRPAAGGGRAARTAKPASTGRSTRTTPRTTRARAGSGAARSRRAAAATVSEAPASEPNLHAAAEAPGERVQLSMEGVTEATPSIETQ